MKKKIFNKVVAMVCLVGTVMMVGCGNKSSDGAVSESSAVEEETVREVKTYVKGDTFELEGCTFTIDDIILDACDRSICAILISVVNNSDEDFSFDSGDIYADNFLCKKSNLVGLDDRLDDYAWGGLKIADPGKGMRVYFEALYPEDSTSIEAELKSETSDEVLFKVKVK